MENKNKNSNSGDKFNLARLHNDVIAAKQSNTGQESVNQAMSNLVKAFAKASPEVIKQLKQINQ